MNKYSNEDVKNLQNYNFNNNNNENSLIPKESPIKNQSFSEYQSLDIGFHKEVPKSRGYLYVFHMKTHKF